MIAYIDENNNVCACTLMSSVPEGITGYEIEAPTDKVFRNAWIINNGKLDYDLDKAKEMTHDKRRTKREKEFSPYDDIIMKQIPGQDSVQAENNRQVIRAKYEDIQIDINLATSIEKLKDIIYIEQL